MHVRRPLLPVLLGLLAVASAAVAAPAAASTRPATFHLRYFETFGGKQSGVAFLGVVAHGTISLTVKGGDPVPGLAKGGTFVTRYDIDAKGTYHGLLVITFAARTLGTMCLDTTITVGAIKPGASFPPAVTVFRSLGGTAGSATLRLAGKANATAIVGGASDERLTAKGALTVATGAKQAQITACAAVARLAKR